MLLLINTHAALREALIGIWGVQGPGSQAFPTKPFLIRPSPQHPRDTTAASSVSLLRFWVLTPFESREGSSCVLLVAATLLACRLGDGTPTSGESEDKA